MITVEGLKALGANTQEGIDRCMGNEDFYLRMVAMALDESGFERLENAIASGDLDAGFEAAHALKGALTNVALTTLADPVIAITEDLRARCDKDYTEQLAGIKSIFSDYKALMD